MPGFERTDEAVADLWTTLRPVDDRDPAALLRRPDVLVRGLRRLATLPVHRITPSNTPSGRAFTKALTRRALTGRDFWLLGAAVLVLPDTLEEYLDGRRQQTLRRMLRKAQRAGITVRDVRPEERVALLERANDEERLHPIGCYRNPDPHNDDLLDHRLWRVTEGPDGETLLLSVIPVDGDWALLRYCRTLGHSDLHTQSRWVAMVDIVEQLTRRGVRHLLDSDHPGAQSPGIRHFQRMVGFRYVRIRRSRFRRPCPAC